MSPLRVVFFGTAEIACPTLQALVTGPSLEVVAVVTQPDKPRGRDLRVQPSAVKSAALALNLPVLQPARARDAEFVEQIRNLRPDLGVVIAYGQILSQSLLDVPRLGFLNVHTSLLPRHRGAAPIHWAILSGDASTGVTIMKMDAGLDTGPIVSVLSTAIDPHDTAQTLHDRLAVLGARLLIETIPPYACGELAPCPQPEGATYARKIEKSDGTISWTEPAEVIERKIRAFTPWPGATAFFEMAGRQRAVKIWRAETLDLSGTPGALLNSPRGGLVVACGEKSLSILELQLEGRKRMSIQEFLAGNTVSRVIKDAQAPSP